VWNDQSLRANSHNVGLTFTGFEMKIEIDLNKCQGYAQCVHEAPEIFSLNDAGLAEVLAAFVTEENEKYATAAADLCPMQAILING
jgi:ferredoxin